MSPSLARPNPPLIKTKLTAPQRRSSLVARPRLLDLLAEGCARKLTLICAPPGYGKTTLLTEWIAALQNHGAEENLAVCWLSLDARDNDPALFLSYLVSAFENVHPLLNEEAGTILGAFPPPPLQTVLSVLINDLDTLARPTCLVLDDYQFITNTTIHEGLAYFLERLPDSVHLVISARSDPPLPLARLRARDELVEIRADDLRFTPDEAAAFLTQVMALPLSPVDISALETRTEGWIAGLQMAAVAMHGLARHGSTASGSPAEERRNFPQFIQGFSGSHRYILDYLAEETLNYLPPEVQRFLAWTSVMNRFCAPLCDALLADPAVPSRDMLAYLDRANLFLVALDVDPSESLDGQGWYRFHHLFADLLRARLKQSQPDIIPQLHLRAAAWFEQNGLVVEAIEHSLLAKEYEQAAALIERYGPARWSQSDTRIIMLAAQLPPEVLRSHPILGLYWAWILIASGQAPEAFPLLRAMKAAAAASGPQPSSAWVNACIDILLTNISYPVLGSRAGSIPDPRALEDMPEEHSGLHTIIDFFYAAILLDWHEDPEEAAAVLIRCVQRDAAAGGTTGIPLSIPFLARIRLIQGRLQEAVGICREYIRPVTRRGTRSYYSAGSLNILLGDVLREWNDLEEAEAQIREGIRINEPWHIVASDSLGYTFLGKVQLAKGSIEEALATLHRLETVYADRTQHLPWEGDLRTLRIRVWLATGDLARAVQWADQLPPAQAPLEPLQHSDYLAAAYIRLAEKKYPEARSILDVLAQIPGLDKRASLKIKINALRACALAGLSQEAQALQLLEGCLSLAEPEGFVRVFVDIGEPMKELLRRYLGSREPDHRAYAQRLLDVFPAGAPGASPAEPQAGLVEALTPRELEVLGQMGAGFSNREIAENLFLSEGTVKFHVHSILEKLDVHSRTAALARARELGLI